jgi:hypothetical protein
MRMRMIELPIPDRALATEFTNPQSEAMTFLRELWKALKVFDQFGEWMYINMRNGEESSGFVDEGNFESRAHEANEDDPEKGWWVLTLSWNRPNPSEDPKNEVPLYALDFIGKRPYAIEVFERMIQDLQVHNVVPAMHGKLAAALAALE